MITRRRFVLGSVAVVGGVAIGYRHAALPPENPLDAVLDSGQSALTPYVIVDASGITIIAPRAEMGQGIHTTLAALVAEELDVDLAQVEVVHGPASDAYANHVAFGKPSSPGRLHDLMQVVWPDRAMRATQFTGGQSSTQDGFVKMREAGAAARHVLVAAAAARLGVPASELRTDNGAVVAGDGQRIAYTELAARAARMELPEKPSIRPREKWRILGRPQPRVDMEAKCAGRAEFSIDVRLPDMLHAAVRINPHLGSGMRRFDAGRASSMRGVREILPLDNGVIVVATNTWYAMQAAAAIDVEWEGPDYPPTSEAQFEVLKQAFETDYHSRPRDDGDVDAALGGSDVIEGEYRVPYLAHAPMEPLNATALLADGRLDIWAGNQGPTSAALTGARLAGIDPFDVRVHTPYLGGGFGRRLEMDFVELAVRAAVALEGTPVKVTWSREEDMTHGVYRPMSMARFRGAVKRGRPVGLDLSMSTLSLVSSADQRFNRTPNGNPDKFMVTGASDQPYGIEHYRVTSYRPPNMLPVGVWRSVGESQNSFFHESAVDELAHAAGVDPLQMRLDMLEHRPSRDVLESVAELSGWGKPLPDGHGMGVAYVRSSGAATAQVIEVRSGKAGLEILNAYVVVDVGLALDPRIIQSQVEGSLLFGLAAATRGEISVRDGVVEQSNFHDYPLPRIHEVPPVVLRIHESGEGVYGVGESATASAAPALGNAIFAATGRRLRELPFARSVTFA